MTSAAFCMARNTGIGCRQEREKKKGLNQLRTVTGIGMGAPLRATCPRVLCCLFLNCKPMSYFPKGTQSHSKSTITSPTFECSVCLLIQSYHCKLCHRFCLSIHVPTASTANHSHQFSHLCLRVLRIQCYSQQQNHQEDYFRQLLSVPARKSCQKLGWKYNSSHTSDAEIISKEASGHHPNMKSLSNKPQR